MSRGSTFAIFYWRHLWTLPHCYLLEMCHNFNMARITKTDSDTSFIIHPRLTPKWPTWACYYYSYCTIKFHYCTINNALKRRQSSRKFQLFNYTKKHYCFKKTCVNNMCLIPTAPIARWAKLRVSQILIANLWKIQS